MPVYAVALGFFVFASGGLPGLSGFVGEFLVLVGAFQFSPWVAAIATVCMILAAAYLLWMYQRVVFGELSEFLKGLGHHLTDMTPTEILTLGAAGGPDRGLRPLPGPRPRPHPRLGDGHARRGRPPGRDRDRAADRADRDRPADPLHRRPD